MCNFQQPTKTKKRKKTLKFTFSFSVAAVDRLQTRWEDSQTRLSDRTKQLHDMLRDSTDWLDAKRGVDLHIGRASEKLESLPEITYTVEDVKRLNAELKVWPGVGSPVA